MPDFHCCGEMSRRLVASGGEADPALALFMERAHGGGSNHGRERKVVLDQDCISKMAPKPPPVATRARRDTILVAKMIPSI
jgi:hypothetical protein